MTRIRTLVACARDAERASRTRRKTCAATTCGTEVYPGRIFCVDHWYFLPEWLRDAILTTFREAEWDDHQEAVSRAADEIDKHVLAARKAGFGHIQRLPVGEGGYARYYTRVVT